MSAPGPVERFRVLFGLKFRIALGHFRRSPGAVVGFVIGMIGMAAVGLMFAVGSARLVTAVDPDVVSKVVHGVFLSSLLFQLVIGFSGFASGEFYDVSRILHLPVGYREVFAAMTLGGLVSPLLFLLAGPGCGLALALGGGITTVLSRLLAVLALLVMGNAAAMALTMILLSILTRRRMRDLGVVLAAAIGLGCYVLFRIMGERGYGEAAVWARQVPDHVTAWFPPGWIADVFLGVGGPAGIAGRLVLTLGLTAFLLSVGSRFLRAAFLGELPSPEVKEIRDNDVRGLSTVRVIARSGWRMLWREPRLKILFFQQMVFIVLPMVFAVVGGGQSEGGFVKFILILLPLLLAFSLLFLYQGRLAVDGEGLRLLLLSPVPRRVILIGRALGFGVPCLLVDVVLVLAATVALGFVRGPEAVDGAFVLAAILGVLPCTLVMLALGSVISVLFPVRVKPSGRRATNPAGGQQGCSRGIVHMLLFVPAAFLCLITAGGAILPLVTDLLPAPAVFLTFPLGVAAAAGVYFLTLALVAPAMQAREERLLQVIATERG